MRLNKKGFTIVELLVATAVFSVILLVISSALLQIGRIYYKGIISTKTQEAVRAIADDVSRSIQFSGGAVLSFPSHYCMGGRRYSYAINQQVRDSPVIHGLLVDTPISNCPAGPLSLGAPTGDFEELMGVNMRLNVFQVTQVPSTNLYNIRIKVVYGDDDLLNLAKDSCLNIRAGSQYCTTAELNTTVKKRL
jgi:prepilin-type N-terminal cleavage/methylation domain-containing protein